MNAIEYLNLMELEAPAAGGIIAAAILDAAFDRAIEAEKADFEIIEDAYDFLSRHVWPMPATDAATAATDKKWRVDSDTINKLSADSISSLQAMIAKVKGLGLNGAAELCGSWIWVELGNKESELKGLGFKISRKKGKLYWHAGPYRRRGKGSYSMDKIRARYGSMEIEE